MWITLGGLKLLLDILQMKNLPVDFIFSQAYQCLATLCKPKLVSLILEN